MIRSFLENATRGWKFRRRLPREYGSAPIWITPAGGLKYLIKNMREIDPMLLHFCDKYVKPGAVVWDIGANVGLFSIASAALAGATGKVFSCEPDVWLVQLLRKSAGIQSEISAPIDVLPIGVAGSLGLKRFALASRSRASNFLQGYGSTMAGGVREWTTIFCVTLNWMSDNLPLPDVLKIDVEGAEAELFGAAGELFLKKRPVVLVEVNAGSLECVSKTLLFHKYRLLDADKIGEDVSVQEKTVNILAYPLD